MVITVKSTYKEHYTITVDLVEFFRIQGQRKAVKLMKIVRNNADDETIAQVKEYLNQCIAIQKGYAKAAEENLSKFPKDSKGYKYYMADLRSTAKVYKLYTVALETLEGSR